MHGRCLGKLIRVCTKASRVHAATPVTMADVLLHWPKGLQAVHYKRHSPGAHEAEISRHEKLHWSGVSSHTLPTPHTLASPLTREPQTALSMPGICHIHLREYPLEKAAFLTGHVSGYRSIKICDIDVGMT